MMKKLLLGFVGLALAGCGASTKSNIETKLENNPHNINIIELSTTQWSGLRIIHPYQKQVIAGDTFDNPNDTACTWVFFNDNGVVESFNLSRSTVDCIDLPDEVFEPSDTIFLVKKGKLQMRKKFSRD